MSIGATIGCLLVGYPVAYRIARQRDRTQTLLLLGVMIPFWTSFVVRTYAWVNLLSNDGLVTTRAACGRARERVVAADLHAARRSRSASSTPTCR